MENWKEYEKVVIDGTSVYIGVDKLEFMVWRSNICSTFSVVWPCSSEAFRSLFSTQNDTQVVHNLQLSKS